MTQAASEAARGAPQVWAQEIAVSYGSIAALRPFSLQIMPGYFIVVLGPNGAGKTTLLKALAGLVSLRQGHVHLEGRDVSKVPAFQRVRLGISLVPEGRGRLSGLTVFDNLELGFHASPNPKRDRVAEFERIYSLFPVLQSRLEQDCSTLSGGEMQMLAVARALLARPVCLLLYEPSLGLAPLAIASVYAALAKLNAAGLTTVLVEQKAVPLPNLRERTIVLRGGQVVFESQRRPTNDELAELYLGKRAV
jgi:branched-chain amino acid transport system ATP-binding protein